MANSGGASGDGFVIVLGLLSGFMAMFVSSELFYFMKKWLLVEV